MNAITLKLFVGIFLALVLFGVVWGIDFVLLIAAFILLRLWALFWEWRRRPVTEKDWDVLRQNDREQFEQLEHGAALELKLQLDLPSDASAEEVVEASVQGAMAAYRPPRAHSELFCELLGLLSYLLLCPFVFALFGLDYVALNLPLTWTAFTLLLICAAAYWVPHLLWQDVSRSRSRCIWWYWPFFPLLVLALYGMEARHPYLNPFHPERERIAAERVLGLESIVSSARHAETVKRYGQSLEQAGQLQEALVIYRQALRLNVADDALRATISRLSRQLDDTNLHPNVASMRSLPRVFGSEIKTITLGHALSDLDGFTVVIVAVGPVPERVKIRVAEVIRSELSVDAVIAKGEVALPEHTRRRGLVTGKQWEAKVIGAAFWGAYPKLPRAPVKYLLLTPADIYTPESNYLFSGTWKWGAVVSLARYGGPGDLLEARTAKQSLCAMIKVFPIEPSTSQDCVTSYCKSLQEFDQKGDTPSDAVRAQFMEYLAEYNQGWLRYKAARAR
jgi:predicted Zn-dependent protease